MPPAPPADPLVVLRAQPGPQEAVLASAADVVVCGGGAGGGKSWTLLLSIAQHAHVPGFAAEIFRRTYPELTNAGGLWPQSWDVFRHVPGAVANESNLRWRFPAGAQVKFSHMQHARDRYAWAGAQVPMVGWDQLETFEEEQFWFLLGRNRDPSGAVRPWMLGTCNPVPEDDPVGGWLHRLLQWWIDPATGRVLPARCGRLRYVVRDGDRLDWDDAPAALAARHPGLRPEDVRSLTFVEAALEDNPALIAADPGYRSRLELLPRVERERLLGRNWNVRPASGLVFDRAWFRPVDAGPAGPDVRRVRAWDKASTVGAGDWSAGVRMARTPDGVYWVEDVVRGRWSAHERNVVIRQAAAADGPGVAIVLEQEPGSGGKESAELSVRDLAGYDVRAVPATGSKLARARGLSAQAEAGNVRAVRGPWLADFLDELHRFDGAGRGHDDQVDAASGAFARLALAPGPMAFADLGGGPRAQRVRLTG